MTLQDAFTPGELPLALTDLSRAIEMVDGWVLRNEPIDPHAAMLAANLLAFIAQRADPLKLSK